MRTFAFRILLIVIVASGRAAAEDELSAAHAEAEVALANFVAMLEHDFDVVLVSLEIRKLLQDRTAAKFGMPLPIEEMKLACRDGEISVEAEVGDVPEAFKAKAQQRVDGLLKGSQYGHMMQATGPELLRSAVGQFLGRRDFDIMRMTPEVLDLEMTGLHEKFFLGRNMHTLRLRVDRKKKMPSVIRFYLQNKEFFSVTLGYKPQTVPGHGEVHMPSRSMTQHNLKGADLPQRYSVHYIDYSFVED